jgi:parvulin-like peptidyl-prolyl isomerase
VGDVSDPILIENGYAIVRLERKIEAQSVQFDDVKEQLERQTRRDLQQGLMQRLAREILAKSNVNVLDPALARSWSWQRAGSGDPGQ